LQLLNSHTFKDLGVPCTDLACIQGINLMRRHIYTNT